MRCRWLACHGAIVRDGIEACRFCGQDDRDGAHAAFGSNTHWLPVGVQRALAAQHWPDGVTMRVRMVCMRGRRARDGDYFGRR
jgi:hypothetical protein